MINSGIMRMFILFYNFFIYIFYFVRQILCICADDHAYGGFCMRNIFLSIVMILFLFYLIIWWEIGIASESKLEVLKDGSFKGNSCFYCLLFFCSIILFYYYSNIPYSGELQFMIWVGKESKNLNCIGIPTHTRVCLEVNTYMETFEYNCRRNSIYSTHILISIWQKKMVFLFKYFFF
jgi:hypothetical protein